jgi:hypothetical protein
VSGPQGHTGPGVRRLSLAHIKEILSSEIPAFSRYSAVSLSLGAFSFHSKTVTASFFGSNHNSFTKKSYEY